MTKMTFYANKDVDGNIHVQNALLGKLGQHHVHTPEDLRSGRSREIEWLNANPCDCGL